MGPKGKPQTPKDKKKKPEPDQDQEERVTELEREFFVFQLAEIDKKLTRLGEKEARIKAEIAEVEDKIEEFKKEKGTIVTVHEELLAAKEEEKLKKRNEMFQLSDEIKVRVDKHLHSIQELELQYNKMVKELSAKIVQLEEEIRILEDYKQNKVAYNNKLEEIETEMNEAEKEHQRNLFKIEKKWENARGRLKKELQSRLLQLSIEFRQTSQKKIGKPCHRVTQENKAIHTALMEMKDEIQQYIANEDKLKCRIVELKEHKNKKREEKDKMIARTIIQVHVIQALLKKQTGLFEKLKAFSALDSTNKFLLKRVHLVEAEIERKGSAIERLKQDIDGKMEAMNMMRDAKRFLRKNTRKLQLAIRHGLKLLDEASSMKLTDVGEVPEEKNLGLDAKVRLFQTRRQSVFNKKGRILYYLYDLLTKAQLTEEEKRYLRTSSESIALEQADAPIAFGRSTHSFEKEFSEKISGAVPDAEEKNPFVFSSLTSLPRSETSIVIPTVKSESDEESFEGEEFEEEEERPEEGGEEEEGQELPEMPGKEYSGEGGEEEEEEEEEGLEELSDEDDMDSRYTRNTVTTVTDSLLDGD